MRAIAISILFLCLTACKKELTQDGRYTEKIVDGKKLLYIDKDDLVPPIPDEEKNNETIAGIDSDNDGVRDDIELWINEEFLDSRERFLFKYMAKNFQIVLNNNTNRDIVQEYYSHISKANSCLSGVYGSLLRKRKVRDKFLVQLVNTDLRIDAYAQFNASMGGALISGLGRKESCGELGVQL